MLPAAETDLLEEVLELWSISFVLVAPAKIEEGMRRKEEGRRGVLDNWVLVRRMTSQTLLVKPKILACTYRNNLPHRSSVG